MPAFCPSPPPPPLTPSHRSRWNKAGADMTEDEVASMSTDQSGEGGRGRSLADGPW